MSRFQKEKLNEEEILRAYREKANIKKNRLANKNLVLENMKYEGLIQEQENEMKQKETVNDFAKNLGLSRSKTRVHVMTERARIETELTHKLFVESVFDTFYDALLLDEDFKESYRGNLYKLTEQTINSYMKENNKTLEDIQNESCAAMGEILEACRATARKTAESCIEMDIKKTKGQMLNEKRKKCEETIKIDDGVKSDFDNDRKFHSKNISDLVQNKVVKVIDDEHRCAEDEEEYYESLDEKIQRNEAPADEELIGEMDKHVDEDDDMEELDESNSNGENVEKEVGEKNFDSKPPKNVKISETLQFYKNKKKKLNETTLFKSLMVSIAKNNINQLKNENPEIELDMNMVFAEAISHYTLLETLYTTKIMNLSTRDMKSFVTEIMIQK